MNLPTTAQLTQTYQKTQTLNLLRQFASLVCENLWNLWWKLLKENVLFFMILRPIKPVYLTLLKRIDVL